MTHRTHINQCFIKESKWFGPKYYPPYVLLCISNLASMVLAILSSVAMMMQERAEKENDEEEDEEMQSVKPWETLQVTMARLQSNLCKSHNYVTKILV